MHAVQAAWVLSLMLAAQPKSPWLETYDETSEAIADASNATPLYLGEEGPIQTAALVTAISLFEGNFKPNAVGDNKSSFCTMQISQGNFKALGITQEQIQTDIKVCIRAGLQMLKISFGVCRAFPAELRIAHYAGGGNCCPTNLDAQTKSKHRFNKGMWFFRTFPHPKPEDLSSQLDNIPGL